MHDTPQLPSTTRRAWCLPAALGCAGLGLGLVVGVLLALPRTPRGLFDADPFAVAVRRAVGLEPHVRIDQSFVILLGGERAFTTGFEVEKADQRRILAALAPLGDLSAITPVSISETQGIGGPPGRRSVRCQVTGSKGAREVTFEFEPHELPLAMFWDLVRAEVHDR